LVNINLPTPSSSSEWQWKSYILICDALKQILLW